MLINFSCKNYASFRDVQQFSMSIASQSPDAWAYPEISTVAALYGPNASGKSNFLEAFVYVASLVKSSYKSGDNDAPLPYYPFLLSARTSSAPMEFSVELRARDGVRYIYSFSLDDSSVLYEELVAYYSHQPSLLFLREHSESGDDRIKFGPSFSGPKKQLISILRHNSLLLSVAAAAGNEAIDPVFDEITKGYGYYDATAYGTELTLLKLGERDGDTLLKKLASLISYADFGIDDIEVRRLSGFNKDRSADIIDKVISSIPAADAASSSAVDDMKWAMATDLYFHHIGDNGGEWLSSSMESEGTLAALAFFSVALRAIERGRIVFVDEIERSLHPMLVKALVSLFSNPITNPKQAQMVFTSHDVSLITSSPGQDSALGREQIWFVNKGSDGASELYPVTEFSPRLRENLGRNYMNGVYQALPSVDICDKFAELLASHGGDANE